MDDAGGRIVLGPASRGLRRALRPIEWVVLEDVALDARPDGAGALVAPTSARRVAEHLGLTPGAVARALGRLRSAGLVAHARQVGPGGRFGLSAYVLGPVPGLDVADGPDGAAPRPVPPRPVLPRLAPPPINRARAVDARMAGPVAAADEAGDLAAEERVRSAGARSPARRGRRPVSQPAVVQLSILDATDDTDVTRHP